MGFTTPKRARPQLRIEALEDRCLMAAADPGAPSLLQMRLEATDLGGQVIHEIRVGQEFQLRLLVKDLRDGSDAKGAFAAFADIAYRSDLISLASNSLVGSDQDGKLYSIARHADVTVAGRIDEAGGVANSLVPVGPGEILVANFVFRASATGMARFGIDVADNTQDHPMLAFGANHELGSQTRFVGTNVNILDSTGQAVADDGWVPSADSTGTLPPSPPVLVPIPKTPDLLTPVLEFDESLWVFPPTDDASSVALDEVYALHPIIDYSFHEIDFYRTVAHDTLIFSAATDILGELHFSEARSMEVSIEVSALQGISQDGLPSMRETKSIPALFGGVLNAPEELPPVQRPTLGQAREARFDAIIAQRGDSDFQASARSAVRASCEPKEDELGSQGDS